MFYSNLTFWMLELGFVFFLFVMKFGGYGKGKLSNKIMFFGVLVSLGIVVTVTILFGWVALLATIPFYLIGWVIGDKLAVKILSLKHGDLIPKNNRIASSLAQKETRDASRENMNFYDSMQKMNKEKEIDNKWKANCIQMARNDNSIINKFNVHNMPLEYMEEMLEGIVCWYGHIPFDLIKKLLVKTNYLLLVSEFLKTNSIDNLATERGFFYKLRKIIFNL